MKQSTSFAQVATNLLNVLQGYTKGIRITAILILLLMGVSNAWALTAHFSLMGDPIGNWNNDRDFMINTGTGTTDEWYIYAYVAKNQYFALNNGSSQYGPSSNGKEIKQDTGGGQGSYNTNSWKFTGTSGIIKICCAESDNREWYPWVWVEESAPTIKFKHPWNGGSWSEQTATKQNDGTYTYDGKYGNNNGFNAGPSGKFKYNTAKTTVEGSPAKGDLCRFIWNPVGYVQGGAEDKASGTFKIVKLCSLTYNGNGNTGGTLPSATNNQLYNTSIKLSSNTLTKAGYTHTGWNTKADGTGNHYDKGASYTLTAVSATLYAEWTENTYTVTISAGTGGTVSPSGSQTIGQVTQTTVTATANDNYEFANWTATGGVIVANNSSYATNITATAAGTLTANFRSTATNSLAVVAGANIESVEGSKDPVTLGSTYAITATPKTGYTFSTWTADPAENARFGSATTANTTVTVNNGSVTVTASATEIMSTLTTSNQYNAGNPGYAVPSATISQIGIATIATVTATAAGNGYTFTGWTLTNCTRTDGGAADATSITVRSNGDGKAATVVANYAEDLTTSWVLKGSFVDDFATAYKFVKKSGESTGKVAYVSLDLADSKAYQFKVVDGDTWYGNNNSNEQYWIKATAENWEFYSDAGNCHMKSSVAGTYTFKIDFSGTYPKVSVQFPTAYKVTYGVGNNKGTDAVTTSPNITSGSLVLASTSITFSKGTTKTGYTWKGWYNNAAGTGDAITTEETYTSENRTDNISVYACYDLITYNITYDLNGGSGTMTPTLYNIETETFTLPTPTKTGYTFAGWHTKSDFSDAEVTQIAKGSTGNKTLYAQWRPNVSITGTYHFFPGERITLNITTPDDGVKFTYQWQKLVGSDWTDIADATTTTYTKAEAKEEDAGHYRCIVSSEGYCDAIDEYDVKCLQLYVYYDNKSDAFNAPLKKVDGATATIDVELQNAGYTYYFKITDGCGNWYGFNGNIHSGWCTNVPMNADAYCGLETTKFGTYIFTVDHSYLTDDNKSYPEVTVTYPSAYQAVDKVIYLDNNVLKWNYSNNADGTNKIYYRIGRSDHNNKIAMDLVPGTANLYKVTTSKYDNFDVWHIANNGCHSEFNSIFKTKTNDKWAATQATVFETLPVTLDAVTVTPTTLRSKGGDDNNNNCDFYNYDITEGMKTWNADVIEPTNGTITVKYTHHDGTAVNNFTSGNRYLAHTCLLTITAEPKTGYSLQSLTVNGEAFTSGNTYTLTSDATIEAAWIPVTYTITYENLDGATANNPDAYTIESNITLNEPTNAPEGYTFVGWYENADYTGNKVTNINGATGDKTLYAKWAYTVQWSVNGEIVKTETVAYGANASAPDITPPYPCDADVFAGWIAEELEINDTDRPDEFVTSSPTITKNTTFYAVFADYED